MGSVGSYLHVCVSLGYDLCQVEQRFTVSSHIVLVHIDSVPQPEILLTQKDVF